MTTVFKTQKVPFHIHSSHANNRTSEDLSQLTIPLDPQLVLPKQYKATAQMFNLTATNSFFNVSSDLGNNTFFTTHSAPPQWEVSSDHNILFRSFDGSAADYMNQIDTGGVGSATLVEHNVSLRVGDDLGDVETKINTAIGRTAIKLKLEVVDTDKHAVFIEVLDGLFAMTVSGGFPWISHKEIFRDSNSAQKLIEIGVFNGSCILDDTVGKEIQLSFPFDETPIDSKYNFSWANPGVPVKCILPDGIYSAQSQNSDGTFTQVSAGLKDLGIEMEKLIIAATGSTTSTQSTPPGTDDSIQVYATGTEIIVKLLLSNDSYSLSLTPQLERFLGIGIDTQDGGVYPPYGQSLSTDYTIPQIAGVSPRLDDFSTLQLRSGLVSALSGEGKPAAILAQFHVPHGTAIGATFDIIPPVPLEVPCQLPNPCNELRFQLTNLRGEPANAGGNNWSASILLTIYER